ncbi:uncharacterized protein NPIL_294771 [Nephila pilipes]|uniref:Uncharacterized protein n=1 Tax=Nephila pilipes TaxID=299642 RepID=A0A8X6TAF4_NEPPI|nr:uncharacterized protein NPIL_294771 [Nephila pilipes]
MTTEIEIAKQKRKAARATYSKTVNKLQEILAAESPDVDDLEIHLDQLTEKFKDLKTSDEIFLNLLQKKTSITQAEYEKEYEIAQDYYEKLSTFKIKVKKAIASAEKENGSSDSPNPTWRPADGAHAATKAKQNLPEIRLPQFDGGIKTLMEENKLPLLSNYVTSNVYQFFNCTTYTQVIVILDSLFIKKRNVMFSRHCLSTRNQQTEETVSEYLQVLSQLSKDCDFTYVKAEEY